MESEIIEKYNILADIKNIFNEQYNVDFHFSPSYKENKNKLSLYNDKTCIPQDKKTRIKEIEEQIKILYSENNYYSQFYNSLITELLYFNKKYQFYYIDKLDLNLIKNNFSILKLFDNYANGIYIVNNIKCNIYFSYFDLSLTRNTFRVITLLIIYNNNIIEIGDIVYNLFYNQFELENHNIFKAPFSLKNINLSSFAWKDSFVFHPNKNELFIKCDSFTLNKIPNPYRHDGHIRLKINPTLMRKLKLSNLKS